ncbi:2-keto-3-deoxygluconate permease [Aerococcaceae bacterium WGS1372]
MYDFMKKFPGGLLLIPMLCAALVRTFIPNFFLSLGGVSEALFTTSGLNYVIGAACFCSGAGIDIKRLSIVLKKQGLIMLVKTIVCVAVGFLYIKFLGMEGIMGISALALITGICSTNPSLYLALEQDFGTQDDVNAFGLIGLFCVPAYPMLVFSIAQSTPIDWTPILSTLVPIIFGMIVGNLDKKMADFLKPGVVILTPFMGWVFGAGIDLISAVQSGFQGIILTVAFYIILVPALLIFERKFLHEDGVSSLSATSIAGMSVSVPTLIAASAPEMAVFVQSATAQIALGVVITSVLTPILVKVEYNQTHPKLK